MIRSGGGFIPKGSIPALTSGYDNRLLWDSCRGATVPGGRGALNGASVWLRWLGGGRYGDIIGTALGGLLTRVVSWDRNGR